MSAHHAPDVDSYIDSLPNRPTPTIALAVGGVAMLIGLGAFAFGMLQNPVWTWGAVLVGLVYTLAMSMGGVVFSVIATLTWARWSRPLKRIAEAFGLVMPILWIVLLVFVMVANGIYPWNPHPFDGVTAVSLEPHSLAVPFASKPMWLNVPFFIARQTLGVGLMVIISLVYLRASIWPDLMKVKARLGSKAPDWYPTGDVNAAVESGQRTQEMLGPVLGWAYAIVATLVALDLVMSLSPWWASNMFPGWLFASGFWLTMQAIGVYTLTMRDWLGLDGWIQRKTTHDLGKLILAFTMAWAYMLFAQILPIWYAHMPEETDYLLVRMALPQWGWLARTVGVLCFVMPFTTLVSRGIKKMRWPFVALLSVMMTGVFLERTLLVMPSIYMGDEFPVMLFAIVSVGIWIGFLGLFFTCVTLILQRIPPLVVSDPKLGEHPWDVHVHAAHQH